VSHPYPIDRKRRAAAINNIVGNNVRQRRKDLDLTQAEASKLLGCSHESYFRSIENGHKQISLTRLVEIADVLGVSAADLLEGA
jgi:transcriptional regulator with XRE-family HTH domain